MDIEPIMLIIGVTAALIAGFLITYLVATQPQPPRWCKTCQQVIMPDKPFSWRTFWFVSGFIYVIIWRLQSAQCPTCGGTALAAPEDFGHFPPYEGM